MRARYSFMFFTAVGASACLYFGWQEFDLSARASKEPEEISLRDLIRRGPDGNPNIILTDFSIFEDYVYEHKRFSRKWTKVWVPIVPADEDEANADQQSAIHVFLYSDDVADEQEAQRRFGKPKLRGMINQMAPRPGIIGSVLISRRYPGTKPSNCIMIVEGKEPAGALKIGLFAFGFISLLGLTGGIWYLARLIDRVEVKEDPAEKNKPGDKKGNEGADSIFIQ